MSDVYLDEYEGDAQVIRSALFTRVAEEAEMQMVPLTKLKRDWDKIREDKEAAEKPTVMQAMNNAAQQTVARIKSQAVEKGIDPDAAVAHYIGRLYYNLFKAGLLTNKLS